MPHPRRIISLLALGIFTAALCVVLGSSTASAQTEAKKSAGTMKQSSGSRKGNDLGSQTQGRGSGMSSRRGSSRSGPKLPNEDDDYDDYLKKKKKAAYYDESSSDDDDFERDSAPTLGRACIYGVNDEVVYRPAGSWCRGDTPPPAKQRRDKASSGAPTDARRSPAAAPSSAYRYPEVRRKKKVKRKTSAGCLYGKGGEILYAPDTSDCVNGIGAPKQP